MKIAYYNTSSAEKLREFQHVFGTTGKIGVLKNDVTEILEMDLQRVVLAKAAQAYEMARVPVIVEHGAIHLEHLNGFPGALVKPLWKTLEHKLCTLVPAGQPRTMRVRSAVCLCDGLTRQVWMEEVDGDLATESRGGGGFHWDPVFIPRGHTRTFAEMSLDEKLEVSPRWRLYALLKKQLGV